MEHAVIRTDKMFGTDNRVGIYSILFGAEGDNAFEYADIDNGNVVKLGALKDGERELYFATAPADDDDLKNIAIVATPELLYDERLHGLEKFYNKAGVPARVYTLHHGQLWSVTKEALVGKETPEKGDLVELADGTKLNVAASATQGATQIGVIADVEQVGRYTYYVIEVR